MREKSPPQSPFPKWQIAQYSQFHLSAQGGQATHLFQGDPKEESGMLKKTTGASQMIHKQRAGWLYNSHPVPMHTRGDSLFWPYSPEDLLVQEILLVLEALEDPEKQAEIGIISRKGWSSQLSLGGRSVTDEEHSLLFSSRTPAAH